MGIVKRSDKKSFYMVEGENVFNRMTGFTEISKSMNPLEYTRKYVDCNMEESDVVGYAPSLTISFDEHSGNPVHDDIKNIFNFEKTGIDAVRKIVTVDFTQTVPDQENSYFAKMREYSVIPEGEGSGTENYEYSATLKAKSESVFGMATSNDNWQTVTFTEM